MAPPAEPAFQVLQSRKCDRRSQHWAVKKGENFGGHRTHVGLAEVLVHRQGQNSVGLVLRCGKITPLVTESAGSWLKVNRDRIVDCGLDAAILEVSLQLVTRIDLHDEGVESIELLIAAGRNEDPLV